MSEIQIVRQPIYTRTLHVFAYNLFYRYGGQEGEYDAASTEAVLGAVAEIGLEHIVGSKQALISLSRPFLMGSYPIPMASDRVIIDVQHDVDSEMIQNLHRLGRLGYSIAFGEFIYRENITSLLELATILKMDVNALSEDELRPYVASLERFEGLKLLADNVQSQERYAACKEAGFNYFQGDFFCKPKQVKRPRVPTNKVAMVQLLSELQRPNIAVSRLEDLISKDVALSYKLLLYINSAFFGLPKQVESIQRGIVFLGLNAIKKWATLLLLARVGDKPNELLVTAVVRAKMCELMAKQVEFEAEDSCFTVGLLSVLDALLDMPLERVLDSLSMTDDVNQALLEHVGTPGEILECVLNYEQRNWDEARYGGLEPEVVNQCYLDAVAWATSACQVIIGDY